MTKNVWRANFEALFKAGIEAVLRLTLRPCSRLILILNAFSWRLILRPCSRLFFIRLPSFRSISKLIY